MGIDINFFIVERSFTLWLEGGGLLRRQAKSRRVFEYNIWVYKNFYCGTYERRFRIHIFDITFSHLTTRTKPNVRKKVDFKYFQI